MKIISGILFIAILLGAALECCYLYNMSTEFSCSGIYHSENLRKSQPVINIHNILITVRKSRDVEVDITGTLTVSGKTYHVDREYIFNYRAQNINSGIIKITQIRMTKGSTDSVKEGDSGEIFPALQGKDAIIRLWKLSPETILIGNAFSPMFSCTQTH